MYEPKIKFVVEVSNGKWPDDLMEWDFELKKFVKIIKK